MPSKPEVQSLRNSDESLHSFEVGMADGRTITVDAPDEDTAKAVAREQGGNVGVLSAKEIKSPDKAKPTDDGDDGASSEEGGNDGS